MNTVLVIFRKELKDTLRDRRTLISMIAIPLLLFPLLIGISSKVILSQVHKAQEKTLNIGILTLGNAAEFRSMLLQDAKVRVFEDLSLDSACKLIEMDSLDAYFAFDKEFDRQVAGMERGKVTMYFKAPEQRKIETQRARQLLDSLEHKLKSARFDRLHIDESVIHPIDLREVNIASAREKLAEVIGGFLPYLFIIFCFLGSMYPAIDLAAGEKERGTLETLLTSPASRMEILLGKFGVVILTGLSTAAVALIGLYLGIAQVREIPPELLKTVLEILQFRSIALLLSLLLPSTIFFAGILLSLSIFAKSYKEAQSVISPMMIVVIVPAFLGLMPGMMLNSTTALIPILNVSLATKAIIAGSITPLLLAEVYVSLIFVAGLSLFVCAKIFDREGTVFRGS